MKRPSVSTIVPFRGTAAELADTLSRLGAIESREDDELILVWNSSDEPPELASSPGWLRVCSAAEEASSYYARNVGARASRNGWLLFVDADCSPAVGLLDLFFQGDDDDADVGIVAGAIVGVAGPTVVERYANAREHLDQRHTLSAKPLGYGQTANLLVRKSVWEQIGGFAQGINSGGDADFSWRAQLAGVKLAYKPEAVVSHHHRQSFQGLWRQYQKYGRGQRWLGSRFDANPKGPPVWMLVRAAGGLILSIPSRDTERIRFACLDVISWLAACDGWFRSNAAPVLPRQ